MSVLTKDLASRFLAPLKGRVALILIHDVTAKMAVGRLMLGCANLHPTETAVLDVDAFYCTNLDRLAGAEGAGATELMIPPPGAFEVRSLLPLLSSKRRLVIIDDLNSLRSLAVGESGGHQLTILMGLLSYVARTNGSWVLATAYRTDGGGRRRDERRSLTAFGDTTLDTYVLDGATRLRAESGTSWPGGELEI
jgi:hypothetical protein